MPLYICRWPNGDFSAAFGRSRADADYLFDQVGNPDAGEVFTAPDFLVHFRLRSQPESVDDFLPFELEDFGEQFSEQVLEKAYPHLQASLLKDERTERDLEAALIFEKIRLWQNKAPLSADPKVRRLQQMANLDSPASIWKQIVEDSEVANTVKEPDARK